MKRILLTIVSLSTFALLNAQDKHYAGIAVLNTQNAMPFGKFAGLFTDQFHPGVEATYGKNISSANNHDLFLELKASYFFHRYVQHGTLVYVNFGYRYKINNKLSAETSIGAGYMHAIPATAKLKLNNEGEYENNKGLGRMQAIATYSLGFGYTPQPSIAKPLTFFINYQQRVQTPFVKSYVPLLPYNSFMIGVKRPIRK